MIAREKVYNPTIILIESFINDAKSDVDMNNYLKLAERINNNYDVCKEASQIIINKLYTSNHKIIRRTLDLLGILVNHCNKKFQCEVTNPKFCDIAMKLLKRKRKNSYGFFDKFTKENDKTLAYIENKLLYLIQLWALTFMMHEDEFKPIMECYRQLRKEGVEFPAHHPDEKFINNFKGTIISPLTPKNDRPNAPSEIALDHDMNKLDNKNNTSKNEISEISFKISKEEIQILKESLNILKEITNNATDLNTLKNQSIKELFIDLTQVKNKLSNANKAGKLTDSQSKSALHDLESEIKECITSFRHKYTQLKESTQKTNVSNISQIKSHQKIDPKEELDPSSSKIDQASQNKFENNQHEQTNTNQITITEKKKLNLGSNRLKSIIAPPPGWKKPMIINHVDLLDTLCGDYGDTTPTSISNQTPNASSLIDDLMNLNFSSHIHSIKGSGESTPTKNSTLNSFKVASEQKNTFYTNSVQDLTLKDHTPKGEITKLVILKEPIVTSYETDKSYKNPCDFPKTEHLYKTNYINPIYNPNTPSNQPMTPLYQEPQSKSISKKHLGEILSGSTCIKSAEYTSSTHSNHNIFMPTLHFEKVIRKTDDIDDFFNEK